MSIEQVWAEQEFKAFERVKRKWHSRLKTSSDKPATQQIIDSVSLSNWKQDLVGNWILAVNDVWVNSEDGCKLPYEIALCNDFLPSHHEKFKEDMLSFALGVNQSSEFIGAGTRGWAGEISFGDWKMVGVYMNEIDITGVERLLHMNLLSIALEGDMDGLRVPKPMFATTNFIVCPLIDGRLIDDMVSFRQMGPKLDSLRDDLLSMDCGWDRGIKIDSNPCNYRQTKNGKIYNIDPVFRNGKIVFG